jgi:hypothetical protein
MPVCLDVAVDANGCRVFPRLPPTGHHPRLFFTEEEIPALAARHTHSTIKEKLNKNTELCVRAFRSYFASIMALSESERMNPNRETLNLYFKEDGNRNDSWLNTLIYAFTTSDPSLINEVKESLLFFANVVVKSCELARSHNVHDKPYNIWHSSTWDMNTSVLFGGMPYALCYDLIFNSMDEDEQKLYRESISLATTGRKGWGTDFPVRKDQTNWIPYMGILLVLTAAIEGEPGFDQQVYDRMETLMVNFMDYAVYDSGHPVEDAYALNLAFREGSMAFMTLARRGFNIFAHPHYINLWRKWVPYALEPHSGGELYGGSSGSSWDYPTSAYIVKFMYPIDPIVDFVYRKYMAVGDHEYAKMSKYQCRADCAIFALPSSTEGCGTHDASTLGLPKTFHCNDRGKTVMRSDWTENAMWLTLDARGDAFLIGHDAPSRGSFVLNAGGRNWSHSPSWHLFKESQDYSLVTIDGVGQKAKAPFVKMMGCTQGLSASTYSAADLTYAYNWEWTTWIKEGVDMSPQGWEAEPHDPREFGMSAWWLPQKVFDERNVGFTGLFQWRRRFNFVAQVARSALMVRNTGGEPFVIVCDNVKQDEKMREYAWSMTTPDDVELASFDGKDAVLVGRQTSGDDQQLVVRLLAPPTTSDAEVSCRFETFYKPDPKHRLPDGSLFQIGKGRMVFKVTATSAQFKIAFFCLRAHDKSPPETVWNDDGTQLCVTASGLSFSPAPTTIAFGIGDEAGETTMTVIDA